ncbi:hypothetical protein [Cellulomonas olei]|uniref:hypothetical protein n=1 Tax=Cellulomonas sp. P4 TaxID=3142533 RepID=UPI0031BA0C08
MTTLETLIEGETSTILGVSAWLRDALARTATSAGEVATGQARRAQSSWTGDAGDGARGRMATLADRTSGLAEISTSTAGTLDGLAAELAAAKGEAARALEVATSGGLTVVGTTVHAPSPAQAVPALPPGSSPAQAREHEQAMARHREATARIATWDEAVGIVEDARRRWAEALTDATAIWGDNAANLVGLTTDLLSSGAEVAAISAVSRFSSAAAQAHADQAAALARHVDELAPDGRVVTSRPHWYDLYDQMRGQAALADDAARAAGSARTPVALGRGLMVLGIAATGYGIYDDIQNGESPAQAAVSNGVGFGVSLLAGAGAGAATGAIIGSFIPVPVVGTVAGAVVGTVVGTAAGLITSGAIDSMWENGVDSLGDVGDAIADGWDELAGTVGDAADIVGDAAGAVGDGVKDVWDALF